MYCKYCSSPLAPNSIQCNHCGARINLNDGGQSFFEDGEIEEWKNEIPSPINKTIIPKTENREQFLPKNNMRDLTAPAPKMTRPGTSEVLPSPPAADIAVRINNTRRRSDSYRTKTGAAHRSTNKHSAQTKKMDIKKKLLAQPNMLIAVCVVASLVLVLIIMGIVAIIHGIVNSGESGTNTRIEETQAPGADSAAEDTPVTDANTAIENIQEQLQNEEQADDGILYISDLNEDQYEYLEGQKISDKDNNEIKTSALCRIGDVIYIPFEDFMNRMDYTLVENSEPEHIEFEKDGRIRGIIKGTRTMYYREGEEITQYQLDHKIYIDNETNNISYVPADSFFERIGLEYQYTADGIQVNK